MTRAVQDSKQFLNIAATTAAFFLGGGKYGIDVSATFGGGSVKLQKLLADGVTYISCGADFTANGYATTDLSSGGYRFAVTTATAVYANLQRIPGE